MKHIIITLFLLLLFGKSYNQIPDERIYAIVDSIVIEHSNKAFLQSLKRHYIDSYRYDFYNKKRDSLIKINGEFTQNDTGIVMFTVSYNLIQEKDPKCSFMIGKQGESIVGFHLRFMQDTNLYLIKEPDFNDLMYLNSRLQKVSFISRYTANSVAKKYYSKHMRDSHSYQVIYNCITDKFYLLITTQKGFRNVIQETILIDAETSEFSGIEKENGYYRSFWETIGDIFTGWY
jgi:hypothetical protein